MSILDTYDQWVSDTVVSTVGPIPVVGVAVYAGLPVLVGSLFGQRKAGIVVGLALLARIWLREQQNSFGPPQEEMR